MLRIRSIAFGKTAVALSLLTGCATDDGPGGQRRQGATAEPRVLASLDMGALELPEGISASSAGDLYVTLAPTGAVLRMDADGMHTEVARLMLPPPLGDSYIAGIAHDADDAVYVATTSADQEALPTGVYRMPADGDELTLFATSAELQAPNGLAFGDDGMLYVSDSRGGAIFRADRDGQLQEWLRDPLIAGDRTTCDDQRDSNTGPNGMAFLENSLYVAITDHGSIVRVPLIGEQVAGEPELWLEPSCERLGIDGLAADGDVLYATVNRKNLILALDTTGERAGEPRSYASGPSFDFPASLVVWNGRGSPELAITNFALHNALAGEPSAPGIATVALP